MAYEKRKPYWLVYNPYTGFCRYRHKTEESAIVEAERMAQEHGKKFHVLMRLGRVKPSEKPNDGVKEEVKKESKWKSGTLSLKK